MGAWGTGPFEDDNALDFLDDLTEKPEWEAVRQVLRAAIDAEYLEAPEASEAIAAAAVVARARRRGILSKMFPGRLGRLAKKLGRLPPDLASLARSAIARVRNGSELAELWAEPKHHRKWLAMLDKLERELT